MATRVLSKQEAEKMGLTSTADDGGVARRRVNPHVQEIMEKLKGTRPGQIAIYEPEDGKGYQTQVLRVRKAFDELKKPWPQTRPGDKGKYTIIRILSKQESFDRYDQQPLAPKTESKPKKKGKSKS